MRQRQQVAARSGTGNARALRSQRGVEPLALGIKTLQNGHAFGHAFNEICFGYGHTAGLSHCAVIAPIHQSSRKPAVVQWKKCGMKPKLEDL